MSVFEHFLVCIFPHSDWIRTRKTPNMENFHAVQLKQNSTLLATPVSKFSFTIFTIFSLRGLISMCFMEGWRFGKFNRILLKNKNGRTVIPKMMQVVSYNWFFFFNNTSSQNINTIWGTQFPNSNSVSDWGKIKS